MVKKDKKEGKKAPRKTLYDDYVDKILPDLSRKVILITGIDDEVGLYTVLAALYKYARRIYILGIPKNIKSRLQSVGIKYKDVEKTIKIIDCLLSESGDIVEAADVVVSKLKYQNGDPVGIDVLINNAEVCSTEINDEKIANSVQVNLLNGICLIKSLLKNLEASKFGARVLFRTSAMRYFDSYKYDFAFSDSDAMRSFFRGYRRVKEGDKFIEKKMSKEYLFAATKIMNVLVAFKLNRLLRKTNIIVLSYDTGFMPSRYLERVRKVKYIQDLNIDYYFSKKNRCLALLQAAFGSKIGRNDLITLGMFGKPIKALNAGIPQWYICKEFVVRDLDQAKLVFDVADESIKNLLVKLKQKRN